MLFGVLGGAALFGVAYAFACYGLRGSWTWAVPPALTAWTAIALLDASLVGRGAWLYVPALGAPLAGYALLRWSLEDRRRGGKAAQRAKHALGPFALLRRAIVRRAASRAPSSAQAYLLGADTQGFPVRVRFGREAGRHQFLVGASGSGKTNALLLTLSRHIAAGFATVCIDFKGERNVVQTLEHQAAASGRSFYRFTLEGGDRWNPLRRGTRSELKDKLIASEEFTERHYQAMYERYLLNLFSVLEARAAVPDLGTVVRLIDVDELSLACREVDDEDRADQVCRYLASLTSEQRRQLRGLQDRLALAVEGDCGDRLLPAGELEREIDLLDAIERQAVVAFSLNASRFPETAKLVGAFLAQDLKTVCGALEDKPLAKRPSIVAVDEFSALAVDHLAGLFQRARSARMSLLLSTQEVADLRRIDQGFEHQVIGNCEVILAGRQTVPESAEFLAGMTGTKEVWEHTFQTDHRLGTRKQGPGQSGLGTMARGEEFVVHPNALKRLKTGEAMLVTQDPHEARLVTVDRCQPQPSEDRTS